MIINVGTRGSKLAIAQTEYVISKLKEKYPEHEYNTVIISTRGDRDLNSPLDQMGSKGIFVEEIERALLNGEIQLAVHSMKDMPAYPLDGLCFAKAWKREDPRDVLILRDCDSLMELPIGAVVATGSKRRSYQLLKMRPDLKIVNIRGNIDTRIRKLHEGLADGTKLDGIVLAAAGLKRLHMEEHITEYFDVSDMIPSPAQGTLAIELNSENVALKEMVDSISDDDSENITSLERGFLAAIGGDCHLPIGAYARKSEIGYELTGLFGTEDGSALATSSFDGDGSLESIIDNVVEDIKKQLREK